MASANARIAPGRALVGRDLGCQSYFFLFPPVTRRDRPLTRHRNLPVEPSRGFQPIAARHALPLIALLAVAELS